MALMRKGHQRFDSGHDVVNHTVCGGKVIFCYKFPNVVEVDGRLPGGSRTRSRVLQAAGGALLAQAGYNFVAEDQA